MTFYIRPYPYRRLTRLAAANNGGSTHDRLLGVNVLDEENQFVLTAQVPGLKASDLTIQVLEDVVQIEGKYDQEQEEYLVRELPVGSFRRVLRMPGEIEADKVEAKINNGLLTVKLPKVESALPKKIKIAAK
jgi:HSP20 family protein